MTEERKAIVKYLREYTQKLLASHEFVKEERADDLVYVAARIEEMHPDTMPVSPCTELTRLTEELGGYDKERE